MPDNNNIHDLVDFGAPEKEHSIIKVIGVGGGGGNAVNHRYREDREQGTNRPRHVKPPRKVSKT